jgi:hypothetical protein
LLKGGHEYSPNKLIKFYIPVLYKIWPISIKMSGSIYSNGRTDYAQGNAKSYISTKPFKQEFLTYTVSTNARFEPVGSTGFVTSTDALCPAGRILHVTGRKLYPGANVGITSFLLSVYDPITFLNGFIDPSSSTFAKYDQNLPNFFDNGPTANGSSIPPLGGQAGKLTLGDISTNLSVTAKASDPNSANFRDSTVGQVTINRLSGTTGGIVNILTTGCRAGSRIILTPVNAVTESRLTTFTITNAAGTGVGSISGSGTTTLTIATASGSPATDSFTATASVPVGYSVSNGSDNIDGTGNAGFTITVGSGLALSADPIFNWLVIN